MEQLLSAASQRMRYAQANNYKQKIPIPEQAKVVIITPTVRIPRSLLRCEIEESNHSEQHSDMNDNEVDDMEFLSRHPDYIPRRATIASGYGDDKQLQLLT